MTNGSRMVMAVRQLAKPPGDGGAARQTRTVLPRGLCRSRESGGLASTAPRFVAKPFDVRAPKPQACQRRQRLPCSCGTCHPS